MAKEEPTVGEVMVKAVLAVELNSNARDCGKAMAKRGVSCAVITQGGTAIGIVTERDLVSKVLADGLDPKKVLVRDIMSTPLITIATEVSLTSAAELMAQYRIRRLVVVGGDGSLAGIITTGDIARSLAEKHGYREATFNAMARYKEGAEGGPYQ
ncbi:MAG TPA: CBS domain-containing protein [Nitrososphaerales archaeon]|nr:CBS domain-containing protein [Nitrososphaerales archaeon]